MIHTCHVGFHVDFSSTEDIMNRGPKLPLCKPKQQGGGGDTLNQ